MNEITIKAPFITAKWKDFSRAVSGHSRSNSLSGSRSVSPSIRRP